MEICRLENVRKTYKGDDKITPVKQVSLSINLGDYIYIEGPSGIGKSTLLYIIGGLTDISSGKVFIDGKDINNISDKELTEIRRNKIGFIFQDTNLIQALTIEENLIFIQSITNNEKDFKKIKELLIYLDIWERRNFLPSELSGGQRRRAMIASTLIKKPLLILADEPTNDLDDYWANKVIDLLSDTVNNGTSLVLVTHHKKWAKKAKSKFELKEGILEER